MTQRDSGDLQQALRTHSVDGYPVSVPIFEEGTIEGNGTRVHGQISYRVKPTKPISFEDFAKLMHFGTQQLDLETMLNDLRKRGYQSPESMLPPEVQDSLHAGGTASWKDVQELFLVSGGCLDVETGMVVCYDFDSKHVSIPVDRLRPGMIVEFHDAKMSKGFAGRIVDVKGSGQDAIVYMESFDPVPFMDAPEAMSPEHIRPGFYSNQTFKIGYGTHEAFQKTGTKLPPGHTQSDPESRRSVPHYILKDPIPLADIETFCKKHYPDQPYCVWQCLILYIIPIHPEAVSGEHQGGTFTPLPTDIARSGEIEVWDVEGFQGE